VLGGGKVEHQEPPQGSKHFGWLYNKIIESIEETPGDSQGDIICICKLIGNMMFNLFKMLKIFTRIVPILFSL